ncbi:type II toxin-antitoxin system RelE/ParE family toxin [Sphingomonas segetis]|uniref:type II toxin-antitoxin system RelE/ParE family toxin n=1 Tax=Sphingomonas segetis TaxID=1104779 RepID=UPI0012D34C07|nr:type II toxin-antitoxin system RelE/ParE family toxin [Sphingomonas segetis]
MDAGKELIWVGSSKEDLSAFPDDVKLVMGFALRVAQQGGKHLSAKPLKGYKGAGVLEIVDDFDGDTYRAVYTVRFEGAVYALDAFQKKSKKGIATSKADLDRIQARLKRAEQMHGERLKEREGNGKAKG